MQYMARPSNFNDNLGLGGSMMIYSYLQNARRFQKWLIVSLFLNTHIDVSIVESEWSR